MSIDRRAEGTERNAMLRFEDLQIWQRAAEPLFLVLGSWFLVLGQAPCGEKRVASFESISSHVPHNVPLFLATRF